MYAAVKLCVARRTVHPRAGSRELHREIRAARSYLLHRTHSPDPTLSLFAQENKCRSRFGRATRSFVLACRDKCLRSAPQPSKRRLSPERLARCASRLARFTSAHPAASDMLDRCKHPTPSPTQSRPQHHRLPHLVFGGENRVQWMSKSTSYSAVFAIPTCTRVATNGTIPSTLACPVMRLSAR